MLPGDVDHPTIRIDIGRAFAGELVVLRVIGPVHPGVGRVAIDVGGYFLDDQVFGVHLSGADVGERYAILPLQVLAAVGIVSPYGTVLLNGDAGRRNRARERHVGMRGGDVVTQRRQVRASRVCRDLVGPGNDIVRCKTVGRPVHVGVHVVVVVHDVRPLPDLAEDVVVSPGAVNHAAVHLLQLDRDHAAAAHWPDQTRRRVPINRRQPGNAELTDVLVDHVRLLHAGLGADRALGTVLDLDDDRSAGVADPGGRAGGRHLNHRGETEFPVSHGRVAHPIGRGFGTSRVWVRL